MDGCGRRVDCRNVLFTKCPCAGSLDEQQQQQHFHFPVFLLRFRSESALRPKTAGCARGRLLPPSTLYPRSLAGGCAQNMQRNKQTVRVYKMFVLVRPARMTYSQAHGGARFPTPKGKGSQRGSDSHGELLSQGCSAVARGSRAVRRRSS